MTALSGEIDLRDMEGSFAQTNRLRTEGTDHLLAAARAAGATRFIAQSFAGWPYGAGRRPGQGGGRPARSRSAGGDARPILDAIRYLERTVTEAEGIAGLVLRYGGFYGPGTSLSLDPVGEHVELVRERKFPIVGDGAGIWSFIHVRDVARATVAAMSRGASGIYNVVDDEPAPVSTWLPFLAHTLGAKPPRKLPLWLGKFAIGEGGVSMMTMIRGGSNAKAKREFGWQPGY